MIENWMTIIADMDLVALIKGIHPLCYKFGNTAMKLFPSLLQKAGSTLYNRGGSLTTQMAGVVEQYGGTIRKEPGIVKAEYVAVGLNVDSA